MVFHSFAELGAAMHIAPKPRKERVFNCRKCGAPMRRVTGTNVYFCTGTASDGSPCTNRMLQNQNGFIR